MKFLASSLAVLAVAGCVEEMELDTSSTEQLLKTSVSLPSGVPIKNELGWATTVTPDGKPIDLDNEFFQDLGTNGRRCVSCHLPTAGWTITPEQTQAIFDATDGGAIDDGFGLGAIFRLNDGANSPRAKVATLNDRRKAYSMLLNHGLIRVGIGMPQNADFTLAAVDDPHDYASGAELSLFRRPMPSTNLKFISAVMWDGRENLHGTIHLNLIQQSSNATEGHANGEPLSQEQREAIVAFEMTLNSAQVTDRLAKSLHAEGANGGAKPIVDTDFWLGINDNLGDSVTHAPFTPVVFDLYDAWDDSKNARRRAVARGQALFNNRTFTISGVGGLNGATLTGVAGSVTLPDAFEGTCTTCHNTPNSGNHSLPVPLDIGVSSPEHRFPGMPLYTFCKKGTNECVQTTDPGRALITGKFADMNKMKGPVLRSLASRAPYFHNGIAKDLGDVVDFYNDRFGMNLTKAERSDLEAFLRTL